VGGNQTFAASAYAHPFPSKADVRTVQFMYEMRITTQYSYIYSNGNDAGMAEAEVQKKIVGTKRVKFLEKK
jgi:hypothetical protein